MSTVRCRRPVVPVFAALAFAIVGCGPRDTSPTPPTAPSTRRPDQATPAAFGSAAVADPKATAAENTPTAKLTAEEFSNAVKEDSNYLIAKHAGKLVELTGVVEAAKRDFGGDPVLLLNAGGKSYSLINCPVSDRNHWSKAFPGQTVTLRGRAPTSAADPVPFVWHIQSVTGPQPARKSVEDFVKEVVADPEATEKKYKGKPIILTGEVAEPRLHEGKLVGVRLALKEKEPVVVCYAIGLGGEKETAFIRGVAKPGQKVTVVVEYEGYYAGKIDLRGPIIDPPY
jgi:hypothetical protein